MPRFVPYFFVMYCFITYNLIVSDKAGVTTGSLNTPSSSNVLVIVTINIFMSYAI